LFAARFDWRNRQKSIKPPHSTALADISRKNGARRDQPLMSGGGHKKKEKIKAGKKEKRRKNAINKPQEGFQFWL
jgi:hypothetical protein